MCLRFFLPTGTHACCCIAGLVEVMLKVDGMVCDGCSSRVEETLQKMAGVKKVRAPWACGCRYILLLPLRPQAYSTADLHLHPTAAHPAFLGRPT